MTAIYFEHDSPLFGGVEEVDRANRYSPLRCWRATIGEAYMFARYERFERLARKLFQDREFVLAAVSSNADNLNEADTTFLADRQIVNAAVAHWLRKDRDDDDDDELFNLSS